MVNFKMNRNELMGFIDIGANLIDSMFSGIYNGSQKHAPDLQQVLQRSWNNGLKKIIITGTSLTDSKSSIDLAQKDDRLFCTVGCHPTNCNEIEVAEDKNLYFQSLIDLCKNNQEKVVAWGEFGLDFDRLNFCSKEIQLRLGCQDREEFPNSLKLCKELNKQGNWNMKLNLSVILGGKKYFEEQLLAFEDIKLPLFLHCRNAADDLLNILSKHRGKFSKGVVHSFDGSEDEAKKILDLGLHIGVNGCSLRTEENLEVIKQIPTNRLLVETDSPWCEIKASHAGFKYIQTKYPSVKKEKWECDKLIKGRNEPCNIRQVLEVLSAVKEEELCSLGNEIFRNSENLFFSGRQ